MKKTKLILPEIKRFEVDDSHFYLVNDVYFPSVTQILDEAAPTPFALKRFFINNTADEIEAKKTTTGDFGTKMHGVYQKLLLGNEVNLAQDYSNSLEKKHIVSFHKWFFSFAPDVKTIKTEETIASLKFKFAGTLDLCVKKGKELFIIDFKTSAGIYENHEWQVSAYKKAFEEMYKVKVNHTLIVRTGTRHKDGYEVKEVDRPFTEFAHIYKTYLNIHGGKIPDPPKVIAYPEKVRLFIPEGIKPVKKGVSKSNATSK